MIALLATILLSGCGGAPSAKVTGRVTCQGKPVAGSILFSPFGDGKDNTGPAVGVPLKGDGRYEVVLATTGMHRIVVSPSDVVYPAEPGEEHPCDLAPQERDVKAGNNVIEIDLPKRAK